MAGKGARQMERKHSIGEPGRGGKEPLRWRQKQGWPCRAAFGTRTT